MDINGSVNERFHASFRETSKECCVTVSGNPFPLQKEETSGEDRQDEGSNNALTKVQATPAEG